MFGNSVPLHMNFLNYLSLVVPIYLRPAFILFFQLMETMCIYGQMIRGIHILSVPPKCHLDLLVLTLS